MKKLFVTLLAVGALSALSAKSSQEQKERPQCEGKRHKGERKMKMHWEEIKGELNLTLEQEAKLQALKEKTEKEYRNGREKMQKNLEKTQKQGRKTREKAKEEVKKILTPEQYQKLEELRAKKHRNTRSEKQKESKPSM